MAFTMYHEYYSIPLYATAVLVAFLIVKLFNPAPTASNPAASSYFPAIDGLRGILAYSVFIHHAAISWRYLSTGSWEATSSQFYNYLGDGGVALFFMTTSLLFWSKILNSSTGLNWKNLYISRFFRLYPLYLTAACLVFTIVFIDAGFIVKVDPGNLLKSIYPVLCSSRHH